MNPLTTFVQSWGNGRALANAAAAIEERRREDWLVQGLALRLGRRSGSAIPSGTISAAG